MLIDWFTVGAQALNFLILVWLLKHFLYKPILNAINVREKLIAGELEDANSKKAEAQNDRDEFAQKNQKFDEQRAALWSQATNDAKAERQRLLAEARKAADVSSSKREEALRTEAHELNEAIGRRTQQEVFAVARKTLVDLAGVSLEARMSDVFMHRLRAMNGTAKEDLGQALKTAVDPAVVRTTFDLPGDQRAAIQNAVNESFSADIHLRFQTTPDLVSGIELVTNGQKVGWNIAGYLASVEKGVSDLLNVKELPAAESEPGPESVLSTKKQ